MWREYSHIKSNSLAQIRTAVAEVQKFLHMGFLLAYPVYAVVENRFMNQVCDVGPTTK